MRNCAQNFFFLKMRQKSTFWNEVLSQFVSNDSQVLEELDHNKMKKNVLLVYLSIKKKKELSLYESCREDDKTVSVLRHRSSVCLYVL